MDYNFEFGFNNYLFKVIFFKYHKFQWHACILINKYISYNTAFDTENYVVNFGNNNLSSRSVQ